MWLSKYIETNKTAKMFSNNFLLLLIIFLQIIIKLLADTTSYWDWDTIKPEYWTPGIREDENITERLIVADIIPNIIPVAFKTFCHIAFPIRWHTEWLYIHHQLIYDFEEVEKEPEVKWPCNNDKLHTLIFTNLDNMNGTHTFVHQFHWWLVTNIVNCSIFKKNDVFGYFPPTKDPVEGVYRQLLLIYEHQDPIDVVIDKEAYVMNKTAPRQNFTIQEFANFNKFSAPVAGQFFKLGKPFKLGLDTQIDFDW
ncbi:putative odorant-binding protein A5 isoform X1 [Planococcus citri]|uniref:putative odorant-binding protein A5 isoform X1 n=1 Tax=Planococcus citri TaxID=170843 RepID=UPI0031F80A5B